MTSSALTLAIYIYIRYIYIYIPVNNVYEVLVGVITAHKSREVLLYISTLSFQKPIVTE